MTDPSSTPDRLLDRRGFIGVAGGAGAAIALGACGSTSGTTTRQGTNASAVAATSQTTFKTEPSLQPPAIEMSTRMTDPGDELFVFTDAHGGHGQEGPMIIDRSGRLVWFESVADGGSSQQRVMNLRVQTYQGEPVLSFWRGAIVAAHGAGHYEIYDTSYQLITTVQAGNGLMGDLHEFRITPQGTALLTAYEVKTGTIPASGGGTQQAAYWCGHAQEVDIETGKVLLDWATDAHVPFSASHRLPIPSHPSGDSAWDYFHINSIEVDPTDGNLIISGRNMWSIYKVNRTTGALIWTLGGTESDFKMGPDTQYAFQHHVVPRPGHVMTIFDNAAGPPVTASQSRGLELKIDEQHKTATFVREWLHHPSVLSAALGSVQLLGASGAAAFVGWGQSSYFTQYDTSGKVILDGKLSGGVYCYRAFLNAWQGRPAAAPKAVVQSTGSDISVYASWNGATVHRSWKVIAGDSQDALTDTLGQFPVVDFETRMNLRATPKWVAVAALDAQGRTLARSAAIQV
jgi:hypothetical protein